MKIRVGIVGMGKMGRIRKKEMEAHGGFEIVALCDVDPKIREEFPKLFFSSDWRELLKQEMQAVVVCTFNNVIPEIVCAALETGLHVFSEKPPGRSASDVEQMQTAEKKAKNKILKFGFNHRYHHGIMEAKAIVDSGRYGKILWARGIYGKAGGISFQNNWRTQKDVAGGGILLDQGIHMLDLLLYFMGDFTDVKSIVQNCYWKNTDLEDNAFALLQTREGKVAMLHSSATQWRHKFSLDLFLEDGYVCVNGILSSTRSYGEESVTFAKKQFEDETKAMGKPREETIYFDTDDSWKLETHEFFDCISGRKKIPLGNSGDALKVMQLIEKIYEKGKPETEMPVSFENTSLKFQKPGPSQEALR